MEQKERSFSGIPGPEIDAEQLRQSLENVLRHTADVGAPALETFTQLQQRRADRMAATAQALREKLGEEHPQVIALENTAKSLSELKTHLDTQRTRLKKWPKPRANEWMVFGTVTDVDGQPAAGLNVRVFDRDRKYDDLLGETETDENGDFSAIYHERDFAETNENLPELYVMVSDASGKTLYSTRESARFNAGKSEYFAIRLGKQSRVSSEKSRSTTKDKTSQRKS
ncbi:MAG: hypothetical protein JW730_18845 [Anaerolineales bacterium]|nr:hypothetical protein [Anaerolineales bacterium]